MKHSIFKLTIKTYYFIEGEIEAADLIDNFLYHTIKELPNQQAEIISQIVLTYDEGYGLIYSSVETSDYGVPQIGISILHNLFKILYLKGNEHKLEIKTIIVHPHTNGKGAIVNWDPLEQDLKITELDLSEENEYD